MTLSAVQRVEHLSLVSNVVVQPLGQYVRGWIGYFGVSQYYRPIPELDEWLRRCIRMCY